MPDAIGKPDYDRANISIGIVHLGIGAFHRAHQAVFTDGLLARDPSWGICGVSLRSTETRDALAPQDGLYTLKVQDGESEHLRIIGSVIEVLVASENPEAVLERMSAPETRIVSLTVTEKGYCHNPATGALDESHPDIVHDLSHPSRPRSAVGFIVEALARRQAEGLPAFTVLSCDNLPSNGHLLKRILVRFAEMRDRELGDFAGGISSPSTMVDRIVPATTEADRAAVSAALSVSDAWPVVTEPFLQWVIEDDFPLGRPQWETTGAVFVRDVSVFETMKLRLLNGSHSTLAYLGFLAGTETVSQAIALAGMEGLIEEMMREEISPTLPQLAGFDLPGYRRALIERFLNPALRHRTAQIAMDGSRKLPQRLLNTIRDRIRAHEPYSRLALGVAAWMRYSGGIGEAGEVIPVKDPLANKIASLLAGTEAPSERVDAYLTLAEIFGADLPTDENFRATMIHSLTSLERLGAANLLASRRA